MDSNLELEPGIKRKKDEQFLQEGREENEAVEQVGRINDLPDHIIAHVLSFLETEEAVRTCILCSRWRYLWKDITRISLVGYESDPDKFSNLVEHVFQNCSCTNFRKINLCCPETIDVSRLNTSVNLILSHKIDKLIVYISNKGSVDFDRPEPPMPQCILSCSTLVFLKLDYFVIQIPESIVCFPRLKSLDLGVIFANHDGVNRLLSSCPVLEELVLSGFVDSPEVLKIDISVFTLRKLNIWLKEEDYIYRNKCYIFINTPNLEYLSIEDVAYAQYLVKDLSQLRHVDVKYEGLGDRLLFSDNVDHLLGLLKGIKDTESLQLYEHTFDVLGLALSYEWPIFSYLVTLIFQIDNTSHWTCLPKVLHSTPNLQVLILDLDYIKKDVTKSPYQWSVPDLVPICFFEHLEMIGIKQFQGNKAELQLVEYLLNNAQALECVMIGFHPNPIDSEVVEKLLMFPRVSETCDVQVHEHLWYETDFTTSPNVVSLWGG